jgi:hypothetical protein
MAVNLWITQIVLMAYLLAALCALLRMALQCITRWTDGPVYGRPNAGHPRLPGGGLTDRIVDGGNDGFAQSEDHHVRVKDRSRQFRPQVLALGKRGEYDQRFRIMCIDWKRISCFPNKKQILEVASGHRASSLQ